MPKHLPKSLRSDEPERLLQAAACPRDHLLFGMGLLLGLRVAELVCRRVEDVDLSRALCMVRRGKGDRDRAVPIPARLLPELRTWIGEREGGWLFPGGSREGHLSARAVQRSIKTAAQRAGIVRQITPHRLRHTYATRLLQRGADVMVLKELLGHSALSTTQIYLSAEPERLRAAVDRL